MTPDLLEQGAQRAQASAALSLARGGQTASGGRAAGFPGWHCPARWM